GLELSSLIRFPGRITTARPHGQDPVRTNDRCKGARADRPPSPSAWGWRDARGRWIHRTRPGRAGDRAGIAAVAAGARGGPRPAGYPPDFEPDRGRAGVRSAGAWTGA